MLLHCPNSFVAQLARGTTRGVRHAGAKGRLLCPCVHAPHDGSVAAGVAGRDIVGAGRAHHRYVLGPD